MIRYSLQTLDWTVRVASASELPHHDQLGISNLATLKGRLPGCVHQVLIEAGVIGDPRVDDHEDSMQWVGEVDWEYETQLTLTPEQLGEDYVELVIDGLDSVARILVDDVEVATSMSQYVPLRVDLKAHLKERRSGTTLDSSQSVELNLKVAFSAPLRVIREMEKQLGARPVNGDWAPFIFMRKAACNFGWDWGPKVATVGVWDQVSLECWSGVRIDAVRPHVRQLNPTRWRVDVDVDMRVELPDSRMALTWKGDAALYDIARQLKVTLRDALGARIAQESTLLTYKASQQLTLEVENPALWWPRRHGDQPLYELHVEVRQAAMLHDVPDDEDDPEYIEAQWTGKIGFRAVRLDTSPDEQGRAFTVIVNDKPIFCIGANWIPPRLLPGLGRLGSSPHSNEAFPGEQELQAALAADFNMIRVWGGGEYATEEMCEFCDTHGIMIWHDFMFACAMYPEEEPFTKLVQAEARFHVARLAHHCSVVLWCGGNECIWGYENWGWKQRLLEGQSWGAGYYFGVLPEVVKELSPTIPYWANSPWSGDASYLPNEAMHGDRHTWDVMVDGYATTPTRFCSEFGHQSPSNISTLAQGLGKDALLEVSEDHLPRGLGRRQRGPGGHERQYGQVLSAWFSPARDTREWQYQAQIMQGRAISCAIESSRAFAPLCMGALLWQLNDVWPGLSWSIVDSQGVPKPAYIQAAKSSRRRILTFQPRNSRLALLAINDTDEVWQDRIKLQRMSLADAAEANAEDSQSEPVHFEARITPRSVSVVAEFDKDALESFVFAQAHGVPHAFSWNGPDKQLCYPSPRARVQIQGDMLYIQALSLIRDLVISPPFALDIDRWIDHSVFKFIQNAESSDIIKSGCWLEPVTLLPGEHHAIRVGENLGEVLSKHVDELCDSDHLLSRKWFMCANWFGVPSLQATE